MFREVRTSYEQVKKTPVFHISAATIVLVTFLTACSAKVCLIPGGKASVSAAAYLSRLQEAGKLPGVRAGAGVDFASVPQTADSVTSKLGPQTMTFRLTTPDSTNAVYWYQISRQDRNSPWRLTKAVQTDTEQRNTASLLNAPVPDSAEMERDAKRKQTLR